MPPDAGTPSQLTVTIMGCGSSGGVPRIGGHWGACDPREPRNRRRRCSLLVQRHGEGGSTTVVVDTNADLREQLIDAGVSRIDGVLYTHDHADHTHGIDDLRVAALNQRRRVDVYAMPETFTILKTRFGYCFESPPGSGYPPILNAHPIESGEPVTIDGPGGPIVALPFAQEHGSITSLGYRFGDLAYSSDLHALPDNSLRYITNLETWIIDALRYRPHPSHLSVDQSLELIERIGPNHAVLTNLHMDLDYATLRALLPARVEPAYDGMVLTSSAVVEPVELNELAEAR